MNMTRFTPAWAVAALLVAAFPLSGCGDPATASPSSISRDADAGELHVDLHANSTEKDGEVCVDLRVYRNSTLTEGQHECGAVSLPPPAIGGYSASVMAGGRRAYLWGLAGPGVSDVGLAETTQRGPVTHLAAEPRTSGCCGVFLLILSAPFPGKDVRLLAYDAAGRTVGGIDVTLNGLPDSSVRQGA